MTLSLDQIVQAQGKILQGHVVGLTILPHVKDANHIRMGDGGGQTSLPVKALQIAGVLRQMGVHHLERDYLSCAGVPGLIPNPPMDGERKAEGG